MNTIDLQTHSTVSDGRHVPREVVRMAKEADVFTISLTDHDAVEGIEEALAAGQEFGVRVIPGIEISVEEHGAHILGYGIDYKNTELLRHLEEFKKNRIECAKKMVENLQKDGFLVEWEDVLKEKTGSVIARPHLARAVLNRQENKEKLGPVNTTHDFIEKFLGNESPNYIKSKHLGAKDTIDLIKKSKGVVAWSHPAIHFQNDPEGLEKFLKDLIVWGLQGVEVFTSAHSEDDVEFVQGLALANNLLVTAGSDFHEAGASVSYECGTHKATFIGDYDTYGFSTTEIMPKLDGFLDRSPTSEISKSDFGSQLY